MKRMRLWGLLLELMLLLSGCGQRSASTNHQQRHSNGQRYVPTLFFHGWGSSYHAETPMANAVVKAGGTHTIIRAMVARNGAVTLQGHFKAGDYRPIVEVNFAANRSSDYPTVGRWAKNVVVALQQVYGIKAFNMVGHSMGNMAITYYLLANAQNKRLPQLKRQVDIAGHFNGILGMDDEPNRMKLNAAGRPNKLQPAYRQLMGLRQVYPRNQVRVLNIYGDKGDGTHSDGAVSNASSQSLRYLVASRAKSYREVKITGKQAQHSKLHENQQVDRLLIDFLWPNA
ncbi:alpha/beta hydrolase [Lactiplantibacillus pentosus]